MCNLNNFNHGWFMSDHCDKAGFSFEYEVKTEELVKKIASSIFCTSQKQEKTKVGSASFYYFELPSLEKQGLGMFDALDQNGLDQFERLSCGGKGTMFSEHVLETLNCDDLTEGLFIIGDIEILLEYRGALIVSKLISDSVERFTNAASVITVKVDPYQDGAMMASESLNWHGGFKGGEFGENADKHRCKLINMYKGIGFKETIHDAILIKHID